jgi:putative oxidoreductase
MEWMLLIGRIIFGGFFACNGLNHFMNLGMMLGMMSGYAEHKGTPAPKVAVAGSGVLLLAGGSSRL